MNAVITRSLGLIQSLFSMWMDSVASAAAEIIELWASPQKVTLNENEDGELLLEAAEQQHHQSVPLSPAQIPCGTLNGIRPEAANALRECRVDVILRPDHFLFRPLDLPIRAAEFLGGIVRSQIDRLMPWNLANTAYGWSKPTETDSDRMTIMVAGTSVEVIKPLIQAITDAGARSICISVAPPEFADGRILIWEEKARSVFQAQYIRRLLVAIIAAVSASTVLAVGGWSFLSVKLNSEQIALTQRIAKIRGTAAKLRHAQLGQGKAEQIITARKKNGPSALMVIEDLSKLLPDRAYVTELRMEGNKLHMTGVTHDAPFLIEALEKSGRFTHVTFFAPTTRSPKNAAEHFHIEAIIEPVSWPRS